MKTAILIMSLLFVSCDDCTTVEIEDDLSAKKLIAEMAMNGDIVHVDDRDIVSGGEVVAIAPREIKTVRMAVVACDPFGWGPEYDWLCTMNGTKGRGIAKAAATPTIDDVACYIESGSEDYPGDITSTTYFNADSYPNYLDTSANPNAFFGLTIAAFGPEWSPILEQWCTNDHIPMCNQE